MNLDLTVSVDDEHRSATVHITGDLDTATTDEFIDTATRVLDDHRDLRALHLDCAELGFCDSVGLSALLLVQRRTSAADVDLHIDNRPAYFERILELTGILDHLTARTANRDWTG
jgi:anti-anti-sigma factor